MAFDGRAYQARIDALADSGVDVHGEVRLVLGLAPGSVLDAGCGTGRVALPLAAHGLDVVGVDVDPSMLAEARRRCPATGAPRLVLADLATLDLGRRFDVVLLAGNVPLYCPPPDRAALVAGCAAHLATGGSLVAGFTLDDRYPLDEWDVACRDAGLDLARRWSTWEGGAFGPGADYAVSLHRPAAGAHPRTAGPLATA